MTRRLLRWFRRDPREAVRPALEVRPGYYVMDVTATTTEDLRRQFADAIAAAQSRPPMLLPAVHSVDAARPAADVLGAADGQPTADTSHTDRPTRTVDHVGATEDFGDLLADMREQLDAEVERGVTALDPDEQARQRVELEWEEAFARAEGVIDLEAARGRRVIQDALDRYAPGWADDICARAQCPLCCHTFDEVMATALSAEPVDYSTAEWPAVVTA